MAYGAVETADRQQSVPGDRVSRNALFYEVGIDPGAKTLVGNESGQPYTADGLRTMINRLCRELAEEGKVKPGLNIHGLRHSLGNELYDLCIERENA